MRGLSALADRDVKREYIKAIVARTGLKLSPAAAWLLVRLEREPGLDLATLASARQIELERLQAAQAELSGQSLIVEAAAVNNHLRRYELTAKGCEVLRRLVTARRDHLAELWAEWAPEKREELAETLRRIARELVPEVRPDLISQSSFSARGNAGRT